MMKDGKMIFRYILAVLLFVLYFIFTKNYQEQGYILSAARVKAGFLALVIVTVLFVVYKTIICFISLTGKVKSKKTKYTNLKK